MEYRSGKLWPKPGLPSSLQTLSLRVILMNHFRWELERGRAVWLLPGAIVLDELAMLRFLSGLFGPGLFVPLVCYLRCLLNSARNNQRKD